MATSPSKPEFALPLQSVNATAVADEPRAAVAETAAPGRDALQALLAFSSLHEQIRQRRLREARNQATPASDNADDFVLYEVLQLVAERALTLTGADGVAIALVQEGEIICRAATGPIAPDIGARLDPNSGISGACFRTAKVVRCDDAETDPRVDVHASRRLNTRSMLAVPLCGRRSVVGLLEAFSTDAYGFNDGDERSLTLLGELILGAMKPQEEERLEELSPVQLKGVPVEQKPKWPEPAPHRKESPAAEKIGSLPEPEPGVVEEIVAVQENPAPHGHESSIASSPTLRVAILVIAAALLATGTIWFRLHARSTAAVPLATPASPVTVTQASAPQAPAGNVVPTSDVIEMSPVSAEDAQRNVLPSITGIRHWESGDSTTVAIDLQDQVQYEVHRLDSPERIYFDLHDTVLAPGLNGKTIEVGDALLLRIRVAQPMAGISRVVLETKNVSNFSVSLASNPYRLIAEISSTAVSSQSKARLDLFRSDAPSESAKAASVTVPNKEDLQLRAHVPRMKIVVDAGHGGWDLGTVGRKGLLEKNLVLDVAQRLGDLLTSRLGSEVIYTRSDDTYIPLEKRAEVANEAQADLFVSVHANYSDLPSARGVETYYTNFSAPANSLDIEKRENATAKDTAPAPAVLSGVALKERTLESRRLAASVERALYSSLAAINPGIRDRGVKEAGFVVLTGTSMPAILAEVSFVSSPTDEQNLQSSAYRQQIAEAIYKGITGYATNASRVKMASADGKPSGR